MLLGGERLDVGAMVSGTDVLGYHAYEAAVTWRVSSPASTFAFGTGRPDWAATYVYGRWRPAVLVSASSSIGRVVVHTSDGSRVVSADERTQEVFAAVLLPWRRIRVQQDWLAGIDANTRDVPDAAGIAPARRNALRAGWAVSTRRHYGYSISPEHGAQATVTLEHVSPSLGADGEATSATVDARAYLPGLGRQHVVAIRAAAGAGDGDARMQRLFNLGGAGLPGSGFRFDRRGLGLLRGFDADAFSGRAAASASLDYRLPLVAVERGVHTWPVFLRTLHAAAFADAGTVGPAMGDLGVPAWSAGAELAAALTLGYHWNVSVAAGVAWTHDPSRPGGPGRAAFFMRTGYAF
jgi:hypothetical protein